MPTLFLDFWQCSKRNRRDGGMERCPAVDRVPHQTISMRYEMRIWICGRTRDFSRFRVGPGRRDRLRLTAHGRGAVQRTSHAAKAARKSDAPRRPVSRVRPARRPKLTRAPRHTYVGRQSDDGTCTATGRRISSVPLRPLIIKRPSLLPANNTRHCVAAVSIVRRPVRFNRSFINDVQTAVVRDRLRRRRRR